MENKDDSVKHTRIRYTLIFSILLILYIGVLVFIGLPFAKNSILSSNLQEHIVLYKEMKRKNPDWISSNVYLHGINGIVKTERWTEDLGEDSIKSALECLLLPLSDDEIKKGLVSYIPKNTKLIGVSESDGYVFVDFSQDILSSSNLKKAIDQIEMTIKSVSNPEGIYIITDKSILNLK